MRSARGSFKDACEMRDVPCSAYEPLLKYFDGDTIRATADRCDELDQFFLEYPTVYSLSIEIQDERIVIIDVKFEPEHFNRLEAIE